MLYNKLQHQLKPSRNSGRRCKKTNLEKNTSSKTPASQKATAQTPAAAAIATTTAGITAAAAAAAAAKTTITGKTENKRNK